MRRIFIFVVAVFASFGARADTGATATAGLLERLYGGILTCSFSERLANIPAPNEVKDKYVRIYQNKYPSSSAKTFDEVVKELKVKVPCPGTQTKVVPQAVVPLPPPPPLPPPLPPSPAPAEDGVESGSEQRVEINGEEGGSGEINNVDQVSDEVNNIDDSLNQEENVEISGGEQSLGEVEEANDEANDKDKFISDFCHAVYGFLTRARNESKCWEYKNFGEYYGYEVQRLDEYSSWAQWWVYYNGETIGIYNDHDNCDKYEYEGKNDFKSKYYENKTLCDQGEAVVEQVVGERPVVEAESETVVSDESVTNEMSEGEQGTPSSEGEQGTPEGEQRTPSSEGEQGAPSSESEQETPSVEQSKYTVDECTRLRGIFEKDNKDFNDLIDGMIRECNAPKYDYGQNTTRSKILNLIAAAGKPEFGNGEIWTVNPNTEAKKRERTCPTVDDCADENGECRKVIDRLEEYNRDNAALIEFVKQNRGSAGNARTTIGKCVRERAAAAEKASFEAVRVAEKAKEEQCDKYKVLITKTAFDFGAYVEVDKIAIKNGADVHKIRRGDVADCGLDREWMALFDKINGEYSDRRRRDMGQDYMRIWLRLSDRDSEFAGGRTLWNRVCTNKFFNCKMGHTERISTLSVEVQIVCNKYDNKIMCRREDYSCGAESAKFNGGQLSSDIVGLCCGYITKDNSKKAELCGDKTHNGIPQINRECSVCQIR